MEWRYSDPSDDDGPSELAQTSRKRSSRACDQCRKTKSKCERQGGDSTPCKSCALAGTACTFLGPSYKRGPPKGYIHAIEQRWHQVESLIGALLQSPDARVQQLISDLQRDGLAREILRRVDMGPYGPSGRRNQPEGATKEDFFASVLSSNETTNGRESNRSRRQSRVSREIVSSEQGHGLSVVPTKEWQDNLSNSLVHYGKSADRTTPDIGARQRKRPNLQAREENLQHDWSELYTIEPEGAGEDTLKEATDAMGGLSLDERQEVRYHSKASGLHLLSRSVRTDDRMAGGIWRLPMARVWPASAHQDSPDEDDFDSLLPPLHEQERLLNLYFTYVQPVFPVIHKKRFFSEYAKRKERSMSPESGSSDSPRPVPSQEVTPVLLLSMFAITARFCDHGVPPPAKGKMWEAGCEYLDNARSILTKIFHQSRPSTVQALLLLGYREFGIGSMEQGWIFIGMGIRMAMDLGLNCDSSNWKSHGHDLFSPEETQARRQIWWGCCLADRYGSMYMGRPVIIKDEDYNMPLPDIDPDEDNSMWQLADMDRFDLSYPPAPGRISSCHRAVATLSIILGAIVTRIYPVKYVRGVSRKVLLTELEGRLDRWYISLPEALQYDTTRRRQIPPPHILFLHIRYWGAVLLLNRAFVPNWKGTETSSPTTLELKAFDLAQGAASHVSAIVATYRENFTLRRCSPFMTSYILSAAIMHIQTLTLRPSNLQASLGFQQCMAALKDMEMVWPSAARAWELLNGVKMNSEDLVQLHGQQPQRPKRTAEDAFWQEKPADYHPRQMVPTSASAPLANQEEGGVQDLSTRIMAHMLGLNVPGVEPSTSYFPGYEWWPRPDETPAQQPSPPHVVQTREDVSTALQAGPPANWWNGW